MQVHKRRVLVGLIICFMLIPVNVWAATYYVSPSGDDNNPGTAAQPWKTIQKAAATVQAGATVIIKDGVYTGGIVVETPGAKDAPIVFRAEGTGAIIDTSGTYWRGLGFFIDGYGLNNPYWLGGDMYIEVIGLTIRNCAVAGLRISCAHHVTVKDCTMQDNGTWGIFTDYSNYTLLQDNECSGSKAEHGIYVSNSSDYPTVRGNRLHHNNACGFQINADPGGDGDGITTGALVEQNIIYENGKGGGAGINLCSVRNSIIRNNLIYHNYAGGIAGWGGGFGNQWGCKNNQIYNNTLYFRSGEGRWALSLKEGSTGCMVRNNILSGGARGAFEIDNDTILASLQMDYNLLYSADQNLVAAREDPETYFTLAQWQSASGQDSHSFSATPNQVFVDLFLADFHLRPGSPCINAGDPNPAFNDRDGSRNDLGAYGGPNALGPAPVKGSGSPGVLLLLE